MSELHKNTEIMKSATNPCGFSILIEPLELINLEGKLGNNSKVDLKTGKTAGGIIIPEETVENLQTKSNLAQTYARVIKVGPDAYSRMRFEPQKAWCKPGDLVRIAQYGGEHIPTPNGKPTLLRIINDNDILCVMDEAVLAESGLLAIDERGE